MEFPNFQQSRMLLLGDLMLDRYWHGDTSRISPEAPVPVVRVEQIEERAGGAGNVALNLQALGAPVAVLGYLGCDEAGEQLQRCLQLDGIDCHLEQLAGIQTTTKLRVLSRHQQLIRLDFEQPITAIASNQALKQRYAELLTNVDSVILSDYGKGALDNCAELIQLAKTAGVTVLIDPKGTDFEPYRGATLLTPNKAEFEAVMGACQHQPELESKGLQLLERLSLDALLITQGEQGMSLIMANKPALHFNAVAREVYDVTGAGDTVIAVLAASLAAGAPLEDATALANLAAGIVVGKLGTATVSDAELSHALQQQALQSSILPDFSAVQHQLQQAQARGECIVLTNGCFDLLHPGHLRYLEQARGLGDRLLVLVNDDASVTRLKGEQRPINSLATRMEMLHALRCVDWVASFSGDTPEAEICQLLPDILVKGGDYQSVETIAGHQCVLANGGEVKILPFADGYSTSKMIDAIIRNVDEKT